MQNNNERKKETINQAQKNMPRKDRRALKKSHEKIVREMDKKTIDRKIVTKEEIFIKTMFSYITDPDIALIKLKEDIGNARHLAESSMREDVVEYMMKKNGLCLQYVRGRPQTEKVCILALNEDADAWYYVDDDNRKLKSVRLSAVKRWGDIIGAMTEEEQEEDVCLSAINQELKTGGSHDAFLYIRDKRQTEKVCLAALKKDFDKFLPKIREENFTDKIINYVISMRQESFLLINENVISNDCYNHYVSQGGSIKNIPPNRRDKFIDSSIERNGYEIQYVFPLEKRTKERLNVSLASQKDSVRFFKREQIDISIYENICKENSILIQYIHKEDWFNLIKTNELKKILV